MPAARKGRAKGTLNSGRIMRDALMLELAADEKTSTGEKVKRLRLVVRSLILSAIDGDTAAAKEIIDRVDGKVPQAVEGKVDGNVVIEVHWPHVKKVV